MDVDDRSTSVCISSAGIQKVWAKDGMNDVDIPSPLLICDGHDDSYPL